MSVAACLEFIHKGGSVHSFIPSNSEIWGLLPRIRTSILGCSNCASGRSAFIPSLELHALSDLSEISTTYICFPDAIHPIFFPPSDHHPNHRPVPALGKFDAFIISVQFALTSLRRCQRFSAILAVSTVSTVPRPEKIG